MVTGAAGFIGSHLVDALLAAGHRVIGIDDFDPWYDPAVKRANLTDAFDHPAFVLVDGDLAADVGSRSVDHHRLTDLLAGAAVVFHLAGRPGVQDSWGPGFASSVERNVFATQRVYEAALAAGVERVVYASSSSVYGALLASGPDGSDRQPAPISPYGVAKLAGEQLGDVYRARGLSVTALRYFTVYGPRQRPDMAIHRLFAATTKNGPTFVQRGDGSQRREFTHVDDVVTATVAAGWCPAAIDAIIDVGGGSSVALREVIAAVERITGSAVRRRVVPAAAGDPSVTFADHGEARRRLSWTPSIDIDAGLRSQWAWHRRATAAPRGGSTLVADARANRASSRR